ncbi:VirK/YbjX family protein [Chromobacterium piscinae]|uniref:VirK/YbjX family protein n=1 Tax=Chromobacterium piscinae TaxID=686831 RepID=UPI001C8B712C|nr:VirK/YbjX family protein [Chromobacterium piscinae]MBX9296368.1 VirK/YbjX family protein [Chromobacterium vaccinii]MBX9346042.1 VirK/YbjX family protein [Chromobacterium vaccinii]MBX9357107.1 VirK/YbjX family protein [Chromobacterium vaccinii]MCD4503158.1 VirK/YbjX family protein [Chromobacterium piscinae]MCD5328641.1 VirK/YbjX family protein [Chromobacterium piscinae]
MTVTNSVDLFWSLATGEFSRRDGFDQGKNRFKFVFRGMLTLPWTLRWLDTFRQSQTLLTYLRRNPRLASKLHRPYLYRSLGCRGKLEALCAHYQLLEQRFSADIRAQLLSSAPLRLADIAGKNDCRLLLLLTHQHNFDKEGEMSLQVCDAEQVPLATLTFTLTRRGDKMAMVIGGLQGPRKPYGAEQVQQATKAAHGLFPKRLAMEALTALARKIGADEILAVGNREHIYSSWRYRRHFFADYDSFWQTMEAEAADDKQRFYRIPLTLPRKAMTDIASKKRSEYQRRYNLLDDLSAQALAAV